MKRRDFPVTLLVVFLAITLPYGLAAWIGGREYVFIGFLLNPADGSSYLAKMYQGWAGAWKFVLPFTAEPGSGAYLFLFYLFLGHAARWLGLSLPLTFHLARLFGAGLLLFALLRFYEQVFSSHPHLYRAAYWLTVVGSGMGWLIVFLGPLPTDFWVAEAYPFLSMFANPHFPIGLALVTFAFTLLIDSGLRYRAWLLTGLGLLLSIILPFGMVVSLLVGGMSVLWNWGETHRLEWLPILCLGLLGGPFLVYQFWAAHSDPVLTVWNAQNQTPSPPIWDFLLSFSPGLLLAPLGAIRLWKMKDLPSRRILLSWLALGLLLVYIPFSLQRRFMLGLYIPVAAIGIFGLDDLICRFPRRVAALTRAFFGLALPTNLLVIFIGLFGAFSHSPLLYLTSNEARALDWIQKSTPPRALILASPEMGRLIPAFTGRRVIYGHPFETVDAVQAESQVEAFYQQSGKPDAGSALLKGYQVELILFGPREKELGGSLDLSGFPLAFETGPVKVYSVLKSP